MQTTNQNLVSQFIEKIWNKQQFDQLDAFIHPQFKDHSLPKALPPDKEGLKKWIAGLGTSFVHQTIIEDQVMEGENTVIRISLLLKHTGTWRGIAATGTEVTAKGFRFYKVKEERIIAHWGLIDGQAIESQLRNAAQGGTVAV